jgi:hypothetical protein
MKYLKIEDNQAFFLKNNALRDWIAVDKIGKDDLMNLLDLAMEPEFEMDDYDEEILANKAHQIIYKSIYEKLSLFLMNKVRFKDQTDAIYKQAREKYQ